jgi:hypothetical protein
MSNLTVQSLVRRVDLFTLKLFLSTIEEGQIGRAAFREHVVPSAATKRFQDLEDAIGMKLFDRTARGVAPSQAGVILARHVRDVMSSLEELFRELGELSEGVRGRVAVAAPGHLDSAVPCLRDWCLHEALSPSRGKYIPRPKRDGPACATQWRSGFRSIFACQGAKSTRESKASSAAATDSCYSYPSGTPSPRL